MVGPQKPNPSAFSAALTRREWYHQALAPAAAILFAVYTALLFSRLD